MSLRPRSIGSKLFWGIGVPGMVAAIGGVIVFWTQADRAVEASIRDEAHALSELLSTTFAVHEHDGRTGSAQEVHRNVTEAVRSDWTVLEHVRGVRVLGRDGTVVWSRDLAEEGLRLPDAERVLAPTPELVRFDQRRAEAIRPVGGMECAGCHAEDPMRVGVLHITLDPPELRQEVAGVFGRAIGSLAVFGAILALLTWVSLHFFLYRPLRRLASAMRKAEEGDFLVRAQVDSDDELGALAQAFNRMLARLTSMKVEEIDTHRDLAAAQQELSLKSALESSNAQLEQRVKEMALLFEVARSLTSTLELTELFDRITHLVAEQLNIPRFSITLLNAQGVLEVKSAWPRSAGTEGITFAIGEGACGRAAQLAAPIYVQDVRAENGIFVPRRGVRTESGSLLAVPMVYQGKLLGVINFERPIVSGFPKEEIDLLGAVADLAATATQNALLHEATVELSITDPLTGASNRRHLFARLELEVARAQRYGTPLSVLMVDIDHFKQLNDARGHRAGDRVLRQVSDLLRAAVRKVDVLARYGGEEFMIILPQASKAEAVDVAEKLRRAIAETVFPEGVTQPLGKITISVGAATVPTDAATQDGLVDCADSALYACKRAGRDKAIGYAPGMELHPGRERGPYAKRRKTGEHALG